MVRGGPARALGNKRESQTSCRQRLSTRAKKVYESLVSIQKNITKPLRRSARVQLRGGLGAANIENREVPPTVIVPDAVSEVATFIQLRQ